MIILLLWLCVLFVAVALYCHRRYSTFVEFGVKYFKPIPFVGNMGTVILRKEHFVINIAKLYNAFPEEKFVGRYEFFKDLVMVRDLELIKKITVKDFEYFIDRRNLLSESDSFVGRNLLALKGQEWRDMRSALSPAFTSSKIRHMVPLMVEVGNQMIASLKRNIESSTDGYVDIECKDLTTRYANDVIASCAFGLKVDSLKDKNNEFYAMGKKTTTFSYKQLFAMIFVICAPKIAKYFDVDVVSKNSREFFRNLVLDTMKNRELHHVIRPDMIHLLMELQKGEEWKDMRSTLSPAFTSSKIRQMVPLIVEVGDQMIASLKKIIENTKDGYVDIECKDLTTRYTNDVIASCAFGLKVDSLKDKNNEFYAVGKTTTSFGYRQMLTIFFIMNAPKIATYFKLDIMSKSSRDFFRNLVLDMMRNRKLNNIIRPDMIHLLMELQKGQLIDDNNYDDKTTGFATVEESSVRTKHVDRVWSDNDLISQAVLFFVAGFETVSTAAIFLLYEVAVNTDIQQRLTKEIHDNALKNGNKFDLNSIQDMKYLDMVVSEVLRKWPPVIALDRLCVKDYNMGKPNKDAAKDFIVRKGTSMTIPVFPVHRDPKYYPDPEKFDPERFSEENKHKINPLAYIPFGAGPRNCIASRFALAELKVMVYHILQHFEVSPCEKTCIPAKLSPNFLNIQLKGGNWLRFRNRT